MDTEEYQDAKNSVKSETSGGSGGTSERSKRPPRRAAVIARENVNFLHGNVQNGIELRETRKLQEKIARSMITNIVTDSDDSSSDEKEAEIDKKPSVLDIMADNKDLFDAGVSSVQPKTILEDSDTPPPPPLIPKPQSMRTFAKNGDSKERLKRKKIERTVPKLLKVDQREPKLPRIEKSEPKSPKIEKSEPKSSRIEKSEPKSPKIERSSRSEAKSKRSEKSEPKSPKIEKTEPRPLKIDKMEGKSKSEAKNAANIHPVHKLPTAKIARKKVPKPDIKPPTQNSVKKAPPLEDTPPKAEDKIEKETKPEEEPKVQPEAKIDPIKLDQFDEKRVEQIKKMFQNWIELRIGTAQI